MNVGRKHQHRGNRTEARVTSELIDRGISVSAPVFGNERYDLIVDLGGGLERVQVKTAYDHQHHEDTIVVEFDCTVYRSDGTPRKTYYTETEIDSYIVFYPDEDVVLYVPFETAPETQMNFSFKDPGEYNAANRKTVNFAEEYTLDAAL